MTTRTLLISFVIAVLMLCSTSSLKQPALNKDLYMIFEEQKEIHVPTSGTRYPGAKRSKESFSVPMNVNVVGTADNVTQATIDNRIVATCTSTPTWQAIDDNADRDPLPNRWPTRILVDTSSRRRVFVAFGGFSTDNLWRIDDGGASWHNASGQMAPALPAAPLWALAQHPDTLVAGSEVGVYLTKDGGRSWAAIRAPFAAAAQDLTFLQNSTTLLVGTFGRGLWTIDLDDF